MTALRLARIRGRQLRERLARHRLVFVQLGSVFEPLRAGLMQELAGRQLKAVEFAREVPIAPGEYVLLDVEDFAEVSQSHPTMGMLRFQIMQALDSGSTICLVSRIPRIAFPPVPGSSFLEDSASYLVPLLERGECIEERRDNPAALLPAIGLDAEEELGPLYQRALGELGIGLLASLDHAFFEAQMRGDDGLSLLEPLELEALRGAGIVTATESGYTFTVRQRVGELADALDEVLSSLVVPQGDIADVASNLWRLERTLRSRVRTAAISGYGRPWRTQILTEDLRDKVLERARGEAYMGARTINEVRNPLEWLTLGELLELVERPPCGGLGLTAVEWRRFKQDVLPMRNRMSHMRLLKRGDKGVARQWLKILLRRV